MIGHHVAPQDVQEAVVTAGDQPSLFEASEPVPRPPGWTLIAATDGVHGWHLVDRTTPDRGVVTVCGITGRVVSSNVQTIVPVPHLCR